MILGVLNIPEGVTEEMLIIKSQINLLFFERIINYGKYKM